MSDLVDPLKFHTFGVKKPLETKMDKIKHLEENNQRYYPQTHKGDIDEWAAVIKRQEEQFRLQQEAAKELDRQQKLNYKGHLEQERAINEQRKQMSVLQKQEERDMIEK